MTPRMTGAAIDVAPVEVPCARCGGSGRVPLSPHLAQLYLLVLAHPQGITIKALRASLPRPITIGTIQNRLSQLTHWNLVRRSIDRTGGKYIYSPLAVDDHREPEPRRKG